MAYESPKSRWLAKALGVGAVLLVGGVAQVATKEGIGFVQRKTTNYESKIDEFAAQPGAASAFFKELKVSFPNQYASFRTSLAERLKENASVEQMRTAAFDFSREFSRSHKEALASAPHENLDEFRKAQIRAILSLADESDAYCARFAQFGLTSSDQPGPAAIEALGTLTAVQVRGMAAGERTPVQRPSGEPAEQDITAWVVKMKEAGVTEEQIKIIGSGKLDSADQSTQCAIGVGMLNGIAALPAEQADRISAYLIRNQ